MMPIPDPSPRYLVGERLDRFSIKNKEDAEAVADVRAAEVGDVVYVYEVRLIKMVAVSSL